MKFNNDQITHHSTSFRQNSSLFINIVSFRRVTFIPTLLQHFDVFFRTTHLWPQNTLQIQQPLCHWSQISFPGAFILGLQTSSSRWESNPENTVDGEEIESAIHAILPSLQSICDTVHCFGESAIFSPLFRVVFSQFLP